MFIKLNENEYVNTQHIEQVYFTPNCEEAFIFMVSGQSYRVTGSYVEKLRNTMKVLSSKF